MLTTVWGPAMWHYLHTMSFNYPVHPTATDKRHYRDFILQLQHVLPCKYCRMNLANNLRKKPLQMCHLRNRDAFSRYIYELHELVNKMLKKKSGLSYCDVRERYEHFRSRCTEERPKLFTFRRVPVHRRASIRGQTMTNKGKGIGIGKGKGKEKGKEKGCTEPLYGKKSKCIINIVPQEVKQSTFQMDAKCIKQRGQREGSAEGGE